MMVKKKVFQFSLKKIYKKKKKEIYVFKDYTNTRKSNLSQLFSKKNTLSQLRNMESSLIMGNHTFPITKS